MSDVKYGVTSVVVTALLLTAFGGPQSPKLKRIPDRTEPPPDQLLSRRWRIAREDDSCGGFIDVYEGLAISDRRPHAARRRQLSVATSRHGLARTGKAGIRHIPRRTVRTTQHRRDLRSLFTGGGAAVCSADSRSWSGSKSL